MLIPLTSFFPRLTVQLVRFSAPRYQQVVSSFSVWLYCPLFLDLKQERRSEMSRRFSVFCSRSSYVRSTN